MKVLVGIASTPNNINLILNFHSPDIVASIANTLEIPHITYDWIPSEDLAEKSFRSMSLNLHPDNLLLAQGLGEIVRSFDWRSYTLVYETEKGWRKI